MEKKIKHPRLDASLSGKRGIRTLGNQKWLQRISSPSPSTTRTSFQYYETKRIRTSDPQFRKLMLYPAELWSHFGKGGIRTSLAGSPIRPLSHLSKAPEREGFEPPVSFPTAVFKTATIDHSDISPINQLYHYKKEISICQYDFHIKNLFCL